MTFSLALRTDKPEAEIYLIGDGAVKDSLKWVAHRQLSDTIHLNLKKMLKDNGLELADLAGILAYQGPGSFTGLRIGLSVANALAASLGVPIAGAIGDDWLEQLLDESLRTSNKLIMPIYGAEANITLPKK